MNPAPIFPHQSLLKPKKITQKQLKLHEYYQPCYKDPLSPRPLLLLSESTMQKPLKTYLMVKLLIIILFFIRY